MVFIVQINGLKPCLPVAKPALVSHTSLHKELESSIDRGVPNAWLMDLDGQQKLID
jgi:hypothetical protein